MYMYIQEMNHLLRNDPLISGNDEMPSRELQAAPLFYPGATLPARDRKGWIP